MVLHQAHQLRLLLMGQFSELNTLLPNRYCAERTFLFNLCVADKPKGNVFDVQTVLGDKDIEGAGAIGRTFIGQIGKREPAEADVLDLAQLVRFLPDGCKGALHRFETCLFSAIAVVVINQFYESTTYIKVVHMTFMVTRPSDPLNKFQAI